jgi:hypothetical protein
MIHLSKRTRRGLLEAVGVPGVLGGVTLVVLILGQMVGGIS